jgi:antitoxin VapB
MASQPGARSGSKGEVRAKLFANGRSQAVRLPKEFRFEGTEVAIRREGNEVILAPVAKRDWPVGYWRRMAALRRVLEIGPVEPLPARFLDPDKL